MFRRVLLSVAILTMVAFAGSSTAEARHCGGRGGFYGGGFYGGGYRAPVYRTSRYYGGRDYYYGAPVYHQRSYYGAPVYRGGYRSGVSLSFGF